MIRKISQFLVPIFICHFYFATVCLSKEAEKMNLAAYQSKNSSVADWTGAKVLDKGLKSIQFENPLIDEFWKDALRRRERITAVTTEAVYAGAKSTGQISQKHAVLNETIQLMLTAIYGLDDFIDNGTERWGTPSVQGRYGSKINLCASLVMLLKSVEHLETGTKDSSLIDVYLGDLIQTSVGALKEEQAKFLTGNFGFTTLYQQYFSILDKTRFSFCNMSFVYPLHLNRYLFTTNTYQDATSALELYAAYNAFCVQILDDMGDVEDDIKNGILSFPITIALSRDKTGELKNILKDYWYNKSRQTHLDSEIQASQIAQKVYAFRTNQAALGVVLLYKIKSILLLEYLESYHLMLEHPFEKQLFNFNEIKARDTLLAKVVDLITANGSTNIANGKLISNAFSMQYLINILYGMMDANRDILQETFYLPEEKGGTLLAKSPAGQIKRGDFAIKLNRIVYSEISFSKRNMQASASKQISDSSIHGIVSKLKLDLASIFQDRSIQSELEEMARKFEGVELRTKLLERIDEEPTESVFNASLAYLLFFSNLDKLMDSQISREQSSKTLLLICPILLQELRALHGANVDQRMFREFLIYCIKSLIRRIERPKEEINVLDEAVECYFFLKNDGVEKKIVLETITTSVFVAA